MPDPTSISIDFEWNEAESRYRLKEPPKTDATRGGMLGWEAGEHCGEWAVLIHDGPIKGKKRVLTSVGQSQIKLDGIPNGPPEEVKYSILAEDETGMPDFMDPIIVLKDDTGTDPISPLRNFAQDVEKLGERAAELSEVAEELTDTTRALMERMRDLPGLAGEGERT